MYYRIQYLSMLRACAFSASTVSIRRCLLPSFFTVTCLNRGGCFISSCTVAASPATTARKPAFRMEHENTYVTKILDGNKVTIRMAVPEKQQDDQTYLHDTAAAQQSSPAKSNGSGVPETVLQYEKQMRKIQAADRAGAPVNAKDHLHVIYEDEHLVVVDKPSGVLCVPGVNNNPSLLTVVFETYGNESNAMDSMIVHRLDMDTSGLVVFARTNASLRALHESFRERRVSKSYEALLCGHLRYDEGVIELPLQRDHRYPPFMRVSTPQSELEAAIVVKDLQHNGWKKLVKKRPKKSQTAFKVLSRELYAEKYPVSRVQYSPVTGRTHQLRVHSAAIGHPIVADPAYGVYGEACANGGFGEAYMDALSPRRATVALQLDIHDAIRAKGQCMCLHAKELSFSHPITGKEMSFVAPPPF